MSEQLPITGAGAVLAATGIAQGLWWLTLIAVVAVVAGAILARMGRRHAAQAVLVAHHTEGDVSFGRTSPHCRHGR